jgi:Putative MetA-pathway of phenol degradation
MKVKLPTSNGIQMRWLAAFLPCFTASAELRPLSTDRPDTTESPHTVDAGHFQVEMEIANWTRDGCQREFSLGELNAKMGFSTAMDLQLVLPFYTQVRKGGEGFGEVEIRLKYNFWGNDSGATALAIMPFIKLPTARGDLGNGDYEGGIIVPYGFEGPAGWSCGVMGEVDLNSDEDGRGNHLTGIFSATTSHAVTETTGIFLELVGSQSAESDAAFQGYFNTGATWAVTPTWQLDGGLRVGLTPAATDVTPFLGASAKF